MDQAIITSLVSKCHELAEPLSVRARNILTRILKDVEGNLLPLLRGTADVRNVPQCGAQTAEELSGLFVMLRQYYEQIELDNLSLAEASVATKLIPSFVEFPELDSEKERFVNITFQQLLDTKTDVRARNLLNAHIHTYRDTAPFISSPELVTQWHGAGLQSIDVIKRFLALFYYEYQLIVRTDMDTVRRKVMLNDYPFLKPDEADFAAKFKVSEGYYPVFYLALRYFRQATYKQAYIFSRILGINGERTTMMKLSSECQLTRERIRQLCIQSVVDIREKSMVWDKERWAAHPCSSLPILNTDTTQWETRRKSEQLDGLDFQAFLQIMALMRNISIAGLVLDGVKNLTHSFEVKPGHEPYYVVGYEPRLDEFRFADALTVVAHTAALQRIEDQRISLSAIMSNHFVSEVDDDTRQDILRVVHDLLSHIDYLEIEGDDIILRANRTNYMDEIRQILLEKGEAMTVNDIYNEFMRRHPDDHHDNNSFIRNYMLRDNRFEAVGSKSTYQLKEWGLFAGMLGELAEDILKGFSEPLPVNQLCNLMLERRPTSTFKSCNTSVYLAVKSGLLDYYFLGLIGLAGEGYDKRFWVSPVTVSGAVRSLRRFIAENNRWPFSSADGIEGALSYAKRKFSNHLHVTDAEVKAYQEAMADIDSDKYPSNQRDLQFVERCKELETFCIQNHRMPTRRENSSLLGWYEANSARLPNLTGCRRYYFRQLKDTIAKETTK